jgi:hypothetical protein
MSDYLLKRLLISFLSVGLLAAPLESHALDLLPSFDFFKSKVQKGQDVWSFQDQFVRIVPQRKVDGAMPSPNDQPVQLDPLKLRQVLGAIDLWGKKGFFSKDQDTTPVFSASELDILARAIAVGLARAKPDQDVTFWIVGMHEGTFSKEQQGIAGRVFFKNGKLNLIFGDLLRPVGLSAEKHIDGITIKEDRRTHPIVIGERDRPVSHNWRIATREGMDFHTAGHVRRDDWLVMDMNKVIAGLQPSQPVPQEVVQQRAQMRLEAQRLAAQRRQMREEMARMRKEMREMKTGTGKAGAGSSAEDAAKSPEERLATLDELRKKKLITEEEYKAKRKEILNAL